MPRSLRSGWFQTVGFAILTSIFAARSTVASDPPVPPSSRPHKAEDEAAKEIKPLPPVGIPDDPPPHEGALIDFPLVIEPPDILVVEVVEALPGRPISGERLVRPDGMISLGFYGDVHVRGLTTTQAKVKIVHHLRKFLRDDVLGLRSNLDHTADVEPLPKPGTRVSVPIPKAEENPPMEKPAIEGTPAPEAPKIDKPIEPPPASHAQTKRKRPVPSARVSRKPRQSLRLRRIVAKTQDGKPASEVEARLAQPDPKVEAEPEDTVEFVYIDPADTVRVFVDVVSFNSTVYYVQGDVGTPGRLPFTGKETVLDAMIYAGGLVPTAEPTDVHLYRPARGDKPAKDFPIDFTAIQKGESKANLQIFPNDRLIVGRNPIVKKTIDMDRASAPINTVLNSALMYSFAVRSLGAGSGDISGTTEAQRDEALKRWVEFLWYFTSKDGSLLDEKALRESLLKKLEPTPEQKSPTPAPK